MTRILLIGKTGQLGWELERTLHSLGEVIAMDYPDIDLANGKSIQNALSAIQPEIIFNAAAFTAVDRAESEPDLARAVNATAPGILAEEAVRLGSLLVHYSTDYVFDGEKGSPYTEEDQANPINVYGRTKLQGERAIQQVGGLFLILRTSWVYSLRRESFVTRVLDWAKANKTLRIVDDQVSSPTWARLLADVSAQLLAQGRDDWRSYLGDRTGLYHLAGGGCASRYDWAREIIRQTGLKDAINLQPAKTVEFPSPAMRPQSSALDCSKFENTFNRTLPNWKSSLALALAK